MTARPGFTLIEIMLGVFIIGIIAAVMIPAATMVRSRMKITSANTTLRTLRTAIDQFHLDTGYYPSSLEDLVEKPSDPKMAKKWISNYYGKDEIPLDPWNNEYQYSRTPGKENPYELYSEGPAGNPISAWE